MFINWFKEKKKIFELTVQSDSVPPVPPPHRAIKLGYSICQLEGGGGEPTQHILEVVLLA
jgi:hypothetical protein